MSVAVREVAEKMEKDFMDERLGVASCSILSRRLLIAEAVAPLVKTIMDLCGKLCCCY